MFKLKNEYIENNNNNIDINNDINQMNKFRELDIVGDN